METKTGKAALSELEDNFVDISSLFLDLEQKFNHVTCPAGMDTRGRLYVINKGGSILYKCFNCGGSGFYRDRENYSPITAARDGGKVMEASTFKETFKKSSRTFSEEAVLWLLGYEVDPDEFPEFFRQGSTSLMLAVMHGDVVRGFQRRYFDNAPIKYLTRVDKDTYYHYLIGKEHPGVVFVVEDLVSSYKIWSLGYSVVALLGTSLKGRWPEALANPKQVVVWLDNDVAGHAGAKKFLKEMNTQFPNLTTVFDRQPKEVPYSELTNMCKVFV